MNTIYLPGPDSFMSTTNLTHGILYITSYEAMSLHWREYTINM